jgi:hypothetical protein
MREKELQRQFIMCFLTTAGFFLARREVNKASLTGKKIETDEKLRMRMCSLYCQVAPGYHDCYRIQLLPILLP